MSHNSSTPPNLADLMTRYLDRRAEALAAGVGAADTEVTPYEAGPVQPIDAKLAWDEALAALAWFAPAAETRLWKAPPQWAGLVAGHEPVVALAFALGNFPQLVRNFHLILQHGDLTTLRPAPGRTAPVPELTTWADEQAAKRRYPQALLALGTLRLARQLDAAEAFAAAHEGAVPPEWRAAWDNERAALAWHAGRVEEARAAWGRMPDSVPVLFNRGMAALFLGETGPARQPLGAAVGRLPERSAWHHLGRLYLTLAGARV